jgi:hypothetical protein
VKIACLGWGSLIWKPAELPVASAWFSNGPRLPIEFCRVGDSGELATGLCIDAMPVPVLWAWLDITDLAQACAALRRREGIPAERDDGIGSLLVTEQPAGPVVHWARSQGIEALIWTGLPPRYNGTEGRVPSAAEAVAYLSTLEGQTLAHAKAYVESVPRQIDTLYRRAIGQQLGWNV